MKAAGGSTPASRAADRRGDQLLADGAVTLRGVAFIACGFDFPGGMEGQARRLAEAVAARGVPVTYLSTVPPRSTQPLREQRGLITVFRLPVPAAVDWDTTLGLLELSALGVLRARLHRLNLIYAVHHETGALAARVGRTLGLPVVIKLACSGPHGDAAAVAGHPRRARLLAALRDATRVVAITDDVAREARDQLGIAPDRLVRLPNGIDLSRFRARRWRDELAPRVLFLGRLSRQKRVDLLLEAFARLAAASPPREDLELVLAGDGPLEAELRAQAAALGIATRVRFAGRVADVRSLLRDARVLALPSEAEGASNALLEALAAGVPAVATALPGTAELVADGEQALLVPPGDAAALAEAIGRLLDDGELAGKLVTAGRERAQQFDLDEVARRHVALFAELAVPRDEDPRQPRPPLSERDPQLAAAALGVGLRTAGAALRSAAGTALGLLRRGGTRARA